MADTRGAHLPPNRDSPRARRAFFAAVVSSYLPALQELFADGLITDIDMEDGEGCSPLFHTQNAQTAAFLLHKCNANASAANSRRETPLFYAARRVDTTEIAIMLLDNGADVSARDERGETALRNAASADMVKLLIERGASIQVRNWSNQTPLFAAVRSNRAGGVEELIKFGADVHATNVYGQTAMFGVKVREGCAPALEVMVKHGASVQVSSNTMETPLHVAAANGRLEAARFLVDHGALVDISSSARQTPLYQVAQKGHCDIVKLLLERGASVHGDSSLRNIPLRAAVNHGHLGAIAELLVRGAWLHPDQPILSSIIPARVVPPSDVEVLDLLLQHIETVVSEYPRGAAFAFNEWVWILMRDFDKVAPELKPQWLPVVRKLGALVADLNSGKCTSSHDTWVSYGVVIFRLWKWMLEYASRKEEENDCAPPESGTSAQDLERLANLRKELGEIAIVPRDLATKDNAATDELNTGPSALLKTMTMSNGVADLKTFVVDEIQRSCQERIDTPSPSCLRPVWAKLHNAALGLVALHEQKVVHGELAPRRNRARLIASEDPATISSLIAEKDQVNPTVDAAKELESVRWKSPESLHGTQNPLHPMSMHLGCASSKPLLVKHRGETCRVESSVCWWVLAACQSNQRAP